MGGWRWSGWLALASFGCGGTDVPNDETPCDPGIVVECPCAGGDAGVQRCRDDGAGYEACVCPSATTSSGTAQGTGGETTSASTGASTAAAGGGGATGSSSSGGGDGGAGAASSTSTSTSSASSGGGGSGGGSGGGGGTGGSGGGGGTGGSGGSGGSGNGGNGGSGGSGNGGATTTSSSSSVGTGGGGGEGGAGGGNGDARPLFDLILSAEANPGLWLIDLEVAADGSLYLFVRGALFTYQGSDFDGTSLLKLDPDGTLAWGRILDDLGGNGAITLDIDGDVVLTSSFSGVLDFGGDIAIGDGGSEVAVGRWDSDGNLLATAGFVLGGNAAATPHDVVVADDGTVVVVGEYLGTLDVGGAPLASQGAQNDTFIVAMAPGLEPLWARNATNMRLKSLVATDGDVVAAGFGYGALSVMGLSADTGGSSDLALLRFGVAPEGRWLQRYGGAAEETLLSVRGRADGGLLLFGTLSAGGRADFGLGELFAPGEFSGFLAGMTSDAEPSFSRLFVGNSAVHVLDASSDASSNATIVGEFGGTMDVGADQLVSQGVGDAWLAAISPAGSPLEARGYGGAQSDFLYRVVSEPGGTAVIAGGTSGTIDLGGGPLTSSGAAPSIVLARIAAP